MISIVMPVYNEETTIGKALESLPKNPDVEVIVVDGQSSDKTVDIVKQYPVKLLSSSRGRALQMNAGAFASRGEIIVFLHADCRIDAGSLDVIKQKIALNYVGGCLTHKIDSPKWIYRWIEISGNIRAGLLKIFYGDQAIFVRRDVFERLGGFKPVALFEDALFSRQLRKNGKTVVIDSVALVLPRRWEDGGIIKTTLLNWLLTLGFMMGVSTDRLAKLYKNIR